MTGSSSVDISFLLQWIGAAILILGCLAGLQVAVAAVLRRLVRRHVMRTSENLVGRRAEVTRTIRPNHLGQVRCRGEWAQPVVVDATSDRLIGKGTLVLITAAREGRYHVLPIEPTKPAQEPAARA